MVLFAFIVIYGLQFYNLTLNVRVKKKKKSVGVSINCIKSHPFEERKKIYTFEVTSKCSELATTAEAISTVKKVKLIRRG